MKKIIFVSSLILFFAAGCTKQPDYSAQLDSISKNLSEANTINSVKEKTIDSAMDGYQAIFLTNGQVYFGKYSSYNSDYVQLRDIYYLQTRGSVNEIQGSVNSFNSPQISLVKLGNEIHGPKDVMYILKSNILFVENLNPEGQVLKALKAYQQAK